MKSRELDCFRDRDFTPFNEIRDNRRQFSVREPTLVAATPAERHGQAWNASESAESSHVSASRDRFQSHRSLHDLRAASAVAGISSNWFSVSCRIISSQITRSSAVRSSRSAAGAASFGEQPGFPQFISQSDNSKISAEGQEERPAASCFRSNSSRSSRESRVVAVMKVMVG